MKKMVWIVVHLDKNGKEHFTVYEDLEMAKKMQPNDKKRYQVPMIF